MQITRTVIQYADPRLERAWAARHTDTVIRANWNAAIQVDPINRDPKIMKLHGETMYPNGAIERFVQE
jgi:hypothetical protein